MTSTMRALRSVKPKTLEVSFSNHHHRRGARAAQIPVIILEKQRNKPEKLPVISPRHESDEANYRWFPSVAKNNGSSLDAAASFETLHPSFAKRWASSPSSDTATRSGCLNGDNNSETNKKCLATSTSSNSNNNNSSSIPNNKLADNNNGPVFSHAEAAAAAAAASTMPGSTLNGEAYTKGAAGGVVPLNGHARATAASSQLLFLVRHGQTDMNKAGKLQGRGVNAHLNDAGLSQAEGLGRFVRNVPFDTVTASSLHRAHETAMRIAELNVKCVERAQENGMPTMATMPTGGAASSSCPPAEYFCCGDKAQVRVRNFEGLDELSWGELEGQNSAAEPWVSKLASLKAAWDEGNFDRAAKGGESLLEVQARASEALEACLDGGHDTNLIVSHGRTLRILLLSLSGLGLDQMTNVGKIPNAGLYIIEARRSSPGAARTYRLLKPCDVD